ncbi:MAG: hypothetical protein ACMG6S_21470 [Byssovorax sp.]
MDIPPPWYQLSNQGCSGTTRSCSGGDQACREQAEKDGYVAVSTYSFCRRDEVRTEPSVNGLVFLVATLAIVAGAAVVGWKRRRRA